MIKLFSVPHTGTYFLKGVLEDAGFKVHARHWEGWRLSGDLIVAPIRNPYDSFTSWVSRQRNQNFQEKWDMFNKAYESDQRMIIVPIDTHDRDVHLKRLSNFLNTDLATDWTPVNSAKVSDVGPVDLSDIYSLPVVKKFYNQNHLTRRQAEKAVRQVMQSHAGERMKKNLFIDSVNQLMEEANK